MTQSLMSIGWMLLALVLSASIGLERQIRGKSAGIRTQAIVGLTACLMMLISKYGFSDILVDGITRYDPSRVASQIVSGIGFLGAGIISPVTARFEASRLPPPSGRPRRSAWRAAQACGGSPWPERSSTSSSSPS